jgi:hypothetical protein
MNLFKSKRQRERERQREVRKAKMRAEDAAAEIGQRIRQMEKECKKDWESALVGKQAGDKYMVDRALRGYRARRLLMTKMDQKRWVFEQYVQNIAAMQVDGDFASALAGLVALVEIDPEQIEDVFETAREKLNESKETAQIWDREFWREMGSAENDLEETVPTLESLEKQLDAAAAGAVLAGSETPSEVDAQISAGLAEVKKLMEG